jgi:hypothetical protein
MIMKTSQALDRYLNHYPDALNEPIRHFGPNYETLLNFWYYLDSLDLPAVVRKFGYNDSEHSLEPYCERIVSDQFRVWYSTTPDTCISRSPLGYSSLEIVCMHKLFENGHTLFYLPKLEKAIGASLETVH